ncbi:hypothetical protein Vretimale_7360 [Volvox reticuliferus]|uniref:Serine-threonine/tyrosine-protein kinase catalytic domain-containing protein n=1 Tax=Volvox reticuliferus TaxID=1737510 RepID=A0A8J4G986_9CHLO|nr:hypothetical protein Vretimale_7360 [Volvox reticuliferus]
MAFNLTMRSPTSTLANGIQYIPIPSDIYTMDGYGSVTCHLGRPPVCLPVCARAFPTNRLDFSFRISSWAPPAPISRFCRSALFHTPYPLTATPSTDIYSFGVMLWQLVTGEKPFSDVHPGRVFVGVCSRTLQLEWPPEAHPMVRKLGVACLSFDKRQRPSFTKVARVLGVIETVVRNEGAAAAAAAAAMAAGVSAAAPQPFARRETSGGGMPLGPGVGVNPGMGQIGSDGAVPMVGASIQMTSSLCAALATANVSHIRSISMAQVDVEGCGVAAPAPGTAAGAAGFPASAPLGPTHSAARQHLPQRLLTSSSRTARPLKQAMVLGDTGAMAAAGGTTGTARHRGGGAISTGFSATASNSAGGAGSAQALSASTPAMPTAWMVRGNPSGSYSYSYSLPQAPCESGNSNLTDPTPRSASITVAGSTPAIQQHPYGAYPHGIAIDGSTARPPYALHISASNAGGSGGMSGVMPVWPAHFLLPGSDMRLLATCIMPTPTPPPPPTPSSPQQEPLSGADAYAAAGGGSKPGGGVGGGLQAPYNMQHVCHPAHIGVHGGYPAAGSGSHFNMHSHQYVHGTSQRPHHQYPQRQLAWPPGQGPVPQAHLYPGQFLAPQPSPQQPQQEHGQQQQEQQTVQLLQIQQEQLQQRPVQDRQHDQDLPHQHQHEQEGVGASGLEVRGPGIMTGGSNGCQNICAQQLPLPLPQQEQVQEWQSATHWPVLHDRELQRQGAVGQGNGDGWVMPHAAGVRAASVIDGHKEAFLAGSVSRLAAVAGVAGGCGSACAHDTGGSCEVAPGVPSSARADTKGFELESQDMLAGVLPAGTAAGGLPSVHAYLAMYPLLHTQPHYQQGVLTHSHSHPNVSQPRHTHAWVSAAPHHGSGSGFTGSTGGVGGTEQRLIHGAGFSPPLTAAAAAAAQGGVLGTSLLEPASFFSTQHHLMASPSPLCGGMISPYFAPYMSCISPSGGHVWPPLRGALGSIASEPETTAESIALRGITAEGATSTGAYAGVTGDDNAMCAGTGTRSVLVAATSNALAGDGDLSLGSLGFSGSASQTMATQNIAAAQSTLTAVKLPDDHAFVACLQQMCSPGMSSTWPIPAAAGPAKGPGSVIPRSLVSLSLTPTSAVSQLATAPATVVKADQPLSPPPPSRTSHELYAAVVAQPPPPYSSTNLGLSSGRGSVAAVAATVPYRNVDRDRERDTSPAPHGLQRHAILEGDEEGL